MTVSTCVSIASTHAKSNGRVLIVGALGFIGHFIAEASLSLGRPTYVLLRPGSAFNNNPAKAAILRALQDKGAIVVNGVINEKESMEKVLKEHEIEIVISAVGGPNILDQLILLEAIKSVGTVKRFLPSEFGHDVDRAEPVEPGLTMYEEKRKVRRMVEESGVPYTNICCNSIASWPYYDNTHPSEVIPPLDKFQIYGDGTVKAYFVAGTDIGRLTMKTVDDVRTINKNIHFRPSCNFYNINELASLWEKKIGKTLPRVTITEDHLLAAAAENCIPESVVASFTHDIFIKGCQINFAIDGSNDVEVGNLYPEETFRTLDECFNDFLLKLEDENPEDGNDDDGDGDGDDEAVSAKTHVLEPIPIAAICG
uniref:NmrA-like domain-containing protein n=1 Tax=Cannabis sativa TaxID=3483 RepID=A0A803QQ94_CANSA